jgi:cell division protease FtsH
MLDDDKEKNREKKDDLHEEKTPLKPSPIKSIILWLIIIGTFILLTQMFSNSGAMSGATKTISISQFRKNVEAGQVTSCQFANDMSGGEYISYELISDDIKATPTKYKVYLDNAVSGDIGIFLEKHGVDVGVAPPQNRMAWEIFGSLIPVILIFGVLYFLITRQMKNAGGGAMTFGKSRAKLLKADTHKITFKDVAGIDEAQEELQEVVEFLKDPHKFQSLGGKIPKGVLLAGPPGTGKTLLARAISGEAGVPFFSISGSDFVEMFVGVGASRVRDMFLQGKKSAPCLIFIDEIDAVGRSRFSGIGGGHDEREQTLNALLVEMDGFESTEGVIIIAATNRPDVLDPALLRPGRFDRQIAIDLPNVDGREKILEIHARDITVDPNVDLRRVARGTPGFSGADLRNLLNEAAILAAREEKEAVDHPALDEARDKVCWGRERRGKILDDKEKKITAFHEAGHAIVMELTEESEPLHKITIVPRGMAYLGATMQLPEKDRYMEGRVKMLSTITSFMGGRVAEELVFGDITSGASSDLKQATAIAHLMVCAWGMSEKLGPRTYGSNEEVMFLGREVSRNKDFSEETSRMIDEEVAKIINGCYEDAKKYLKENMESLKKLAELLLVDETVEGCIVKEILENGRPLTAEERREREPKKEEDNEEPKEEEEKVVASENIEQDVEEEVEEAETSV